MEPMDQLFEDAVAAFRRRLVEAVEVMRGAEDALSFSDAERVLTGLAQELASDMTQRVLQDVSNDKSRRKHALERVRERAAQRGIELRVERNRKTLVRTLGGRTIEVVTSYATARPRGGEPLETRRSQGTGVYPVLDQLGISGRSTPALRLLVSRAVCEANSVEAARDLLAGGGVEVDHKAALRLTYMVCDDALRARQEAVRTTTMGNDEGAFAGRRIAVAVDGGRVNIRRRVAGRPRKGGRKHFETDWREPKVLTIYVIGEDGRRDRSVPSVIDGTLGDADAVFALMRYHLLRLGAHRAEELVLIGDGAPWIWNRADALRQELGIPEARFHEVLDYFHAVERLGELSKGQAGWSDELRTRWLRAQKDRLKQGDVEHIEDVVRALHRDDPGQLATELDYWQRNRARLRYGDFRSHGFPIGSGAVESSVRRVVNLRLKGSSIWWTEEHAEGILHLRAHAKSGRWRELEQTVLLNTGWRPTARRGRRAA
jgi:hypothetical protein